MSNNRSPPNPSSFPFLVVEYEKIKALIGRDTNYQETLLSIKKLFSTLKDTPDEIIRINAHIEEIDDTCRIADGIWSELLPRLTVVQVVVDNPTQSSKPDEVPSEPTKSKEQAISQVTIHVHRHESDGWSSPVIAMHTTRISLDCTFEQLLDQVKRQENIEGEFYEFRYGSRYPSFADVLGQYGLTASSVVEATMLQ